MKIKSELTTVNKFHIILIIIGIIFSGASIFHSNLWFDESYSVGMASHNWVEIWNIGGHDVHPVLYYWVISLIGLVTGKSIIAYRLFSALCIALTGILGYTHIRKDFGNKTGILFSFFTFFLPAVSGFAGEIRMYSMAMLLVTICAIYAYRIYKGDTLWKNWIIFELASLSCLYTHYYGLMAAGLINVMMLINFIKFRRSESIKRIILFGILQFALYVPWLIYFSSQLKQVSTGFWIGYEFPKTIIEIASFQLRGKIDNYYIAFIPVIILYIYLIVKMITLKAKKQEVLPAAVSALLYIAIIAAAAIMKEILHTSILLDRYLFVVTGLYIFAISFILSKEKSKLIVAIICMVTLVLSVKSNIISIKENYAENNMEQIKYLKENIKPEDSFVYTDAITGSVISVYFPDNDQYFYNENNWGVEEAYRAFGDNYHTEANGDFLNETQGRIWVVDSWDDYCYKKYFENDEYTFVEQKEIYTDYHNYKYLLTLVEKK